MARRWHRKNSVFRSTTKVKLRARADTGGERHNLDDDGRAEDLPVYRVSRGCPQGALYRCDKAPRGLSQWRRSGEFCGVASSTRGRRSEFFQANSPRRSRHDTRSAACPDLKAREPCLPASPATAERLSTPRCASAIRTRRPWASGANARGAPNDHLAVSSCASGSSYPSVLTFSSEL